jgi:carboxynorspermidine decarboxylase
MGPGEDRKVIEQISGFMFHNNCENGDFGLFDKMLTHIEERFGHLLHKVEWVSLGGGIHFTGEDYAVDAFCARLKRSRKPTACRCTWSRAKRRSPTAPRWK